METTAYQVALQKISRFNATLDPSNVKKILLLYDEKDYYLGDTCIRVGLIESLSGMFPGAAIDLFWRSERHTNLYCAFLLNNPYLNSYSLTTWPEIGFEAYDIVFVMSFDESQLLEIITDKYDLAFTNAVWDTAIFSLGRQVLDYKLKDLVPVFGEYPDFSTSIKSHVSTYKLFITRGERDWAASWLKSHGVKENERLFIVLDSSTVKTKLLRIDVYFEVLRYLLGMEGVRILIFDERGAGKSAFYQEWLGEEAMSKMIFSERLPLRQDLCIIASDHTRLVFGPCTGLMHCASAIFNNFVQSGMPVSSAPLMITYTGRYDAPEHNAMKWWGASPLTTCLVLRRGSEGKEAVLLGTLSEQEAMDTSRLLVCGEYTAAMIIPHLQSLQAKDLSFDVVTI